MSPLAGNTGGESDLAEELIKDLLLANRLSMFLSWLGQLELARRGWC